MSLCPVFTIFGNSLQSDLEIRCVCPDREIVLLSVSLALTGSGSFQMDMRSGDIFFKKSGIYCFFDIGSIILSVYRNSRSFKWKIERNEKR